MRHSSHEAKKTADSGGGDDDADDGYDDNYFTVQKHDSGKQVMSKFMST